VLPTNGSDSSLVTQQSSFALAAAHAICVIAGITYSESELLFSRPTDRCDEWQAVALSDNVRPGDARAAQCPGQALVLWRNVNGKLFANDAYCPHLGAHLGFGGSIEGDSIRCPFHGWSFSSDGSCIDIPYSQRRPTRAKLGIWAVSEVEGVVFVRRAVASRQDVSSRFPPYFQSDEGFKESTELLTVSVPHISFSPRILADWQQMLTEAQSREVGAQQAQKCYTLDFSLEQSSGGLVDDLAAPLTIAVCDSSAVLIQSRFLGQTFRVRAFLNSIDNDHVQVRMTAGTWGVIQSTHAADSLVNDIGEACKRFGATDCATV
jgi:nitrite reductase/ring-hydroxylating ferredoxin subunit